MNSIEIKCEACESQMALSAGLVQRLEGRRGRVTCKHCGNKIGLDARTVDFTVTYGGSLLLKHEELELEAVAAEQDPHMSEMPAGIESERLPRSVSLPPPISDELKLRRSMAQAKSARRVESRPAHASLSNLAAGMSALPHAPAEAPAPPMRSQEDTLSPHSFDDEDELAAIPAHGEIKSSPFSAPSPRDAAFESIFPQIAHPEKIKEAEAPSPLLSRRPAPPKAGQLHRSLAPQRGSFQSQFDLRDEKISVAVARDGSLVNLSDKPEDYRNSSEPQILTPAFPPKAPRKGGLIPWTIAAVALLGLGLSVASQGNLGDQVQQWLAPSQASGLSRMAEHKGSEFDSSRAAQAPVVEEAPVKLVLAMISPVTSSSAVVKKSSPKAAVRSGGAEPAAEKEEEPTAAPFSAAAASGALRNATASASSCRGAADPSGVAQVSVTFSPSGRVTSAKVAGPPFAGTATGGCIASRFRKARIPAFAGAHVTVTKTVTIR